MPEQIHKSNIAPALANLAIPLSGLTPDPRNANEHDDRSIKGIMASLADLGQRKPVCVQLKADDGTANVVRAGNGTVEAARRLGWTHIAALVVDEPDVKAIDFAIRDNRTAQLSNWNVHVLGDSLAYLDSNGVQLDRVGWTDYEAEPIMAVEWNPPEVDETPIVKPEKKRSLRLSQAEWAKLRELCGEEPSGMRIVQLLTASMTPSM